MVGEHIASMAVDIVRASNSAHVAQLAYTTGRTVPSSCFWAKIAPSPKPEVSVSSRNPTSKRGYARTGASIRERFRDCGRSRGVGCGGHMCGDQVIDENQLLRGEWR